jgi:hypothetical protein
MKTTESRATSGCKSLEDLRLLILHLSELRTAAALGLKLPLPPVLEQARRDGAATRSP